MKSKKSLVVHKRPQDGYHVKKVQTHLETVTTDQHQLVINKINEYLKNKLIFISKVILLSSISLEFIFPSMYEEIHQKII